MFVLLLVYTVGGQTMLQEWDRFPSLESCVAFALQPQMQPAADIIARQNGWDKAEFGCAQVKAGKDQI